MAPTINDSSQGGLPLRSDYSSNRLARLDPVSVRSHPRPMEFITAVPQNTN
jgi:hypothetical protein